MLVYFAILFIVLLLVFASNNLKDNPTLETVIFYSSAIILVLFAGFRANFVGTDTNNYIGMFIAKSNQEQSIFEIEGNVELGAGFQGQYNQRRINPYNLTFESQFGSGGFNTGMATPEMSKASTMSYTSFNAGLLLNVKSLEGRRVYFGLAAYNTNQAKSNLLDATFIEPIRWNIQSGATIPMNESTNLHFSSIVCLQQGASEVLFGAVGSFDLIENGGGKKLLLGSWARP